MTIVFILEKYHNLTYIKQYTSDILILELDNSANNIPYIIIFKY